MWLASITYFFTSSEAPNIVKALSKVEIASWPVEARMVFRNFHADAPMFYQYEDDLVVVHKCDVPEQGRSGFLMHRLPVDPAHPRQTCFSKLVDCPELKDREVIWDPSSGICAGCGKHEKSQLESVFMFRASFH